MSQPQSSAAYRSLLTPQNCVLTLIDHQPQMSFGVISIDRQSLINNVTGLAKAAKLFGVPTVLTTIAAKTFSGDIYPEIAEVFPGQEIIDRTSMNAWEDATFRDAIEQTGRKKLVIAGLWTQVCVDFPALCAIEDGYEVYVVHDASGDTTPENHHWAMERAVQAGAIPLNWLQFMLELQRDWARQATYDAVMDIAKAHAGAYGIGVRYAKAILGEHAHEGG